LTHGTEQIDQLPGLNCDNYRFAGFNRPGVIGCNNESTFSELAQRLRLSSCDKYLRRAKSARGHQPLGNRLTDIASTQNGNILRKGEICFLLACHFPPSKS
jgi:hypothetical protein